MRSDEVFNRSFLTKWEKPAQKTVLPDLEPCRGCGGEAIFRKEKRSDPPVSYLVLYAECTCCGLRTRDEPCDGYYGRSITPEEVAEIWKGKDTCATVVHANNITYTHPSDMFVCGNCSFTCEITKLVYEDEDDPGMGVPTAHEYECKFCPDCGAKMDGIVQCS